MGELPQDLKRKRVDASEEEKKLKLDDILKEIRVMYENDEDDDAVFNRFPKYSLLYGESLS